MGMKLMNMKRINQASCSTRLDPGWWIHITMTPCFAPFFVGEIWNVLRTQRFRLFKWVDEMYVQMLIQLVDSFLFTSFQPQMNLATMTERSTLKTMWRILSSPFVNHWSLRRKWLSCTGSGNRISTSWRSMTSLYLLHAVWRHMESIRTRWKIIEARNSTLESVSQASAHSRSVNVFSTFGGRKYRKSISKGRCLSFIWHTRSIERWRSTRLGSNVLQAWHVAMFGDVPSSKCCFSRKFYSWDV